MVDLFIRLLLSYILLSAHSNALGEQINQDVSGSKSTVIGKNTGPITITNRYDVLKIDLEMVVLPSLHIAMGKYEVTQGQWSQVMGHNPVTSDKYDCVNDKCPVVNVGYNDILAFIEQLNQRTGNHYRLPNEEEWYAACQSKRWPGEQSSELCGGSNSDIDKVAWYYSNVPLGKAHPVGEKIPNFWGLYDMSGNVDEWTSSCMNPSICDLHVFRGGSINDSVEGLLSTQRNTVEPESGGTSHVGFRLAQDL